MKTVRKLAWPVIGLAAIVFSLYGLYHELHGLSAADFMDSLKAVSLKKLVLGRRRYACRLRGACGL